MPEGGPVLPTMAATQAPLWSPQSWTPGHLRAHTDRGRTHLQTLRALTHASTSVDLGLEKETLQVTAEGCWELKHHSGAREMAQQPEHLL